MTSTETPNPIEDAERHYAGGFPVPFSATLAESAREAGHPVEAAYWDAYAARLWELDHS